MTTPIYGPECILELFVAAHLARMCEICRSALATCVRMCENLDAFLNADGARTESAPGPSALHQ
eukprot:1396324-Karenia_brevis.AAC.1